MSLLQLAVLAAIQGLTELLPVSSSAHVILAERLMGLDPSAPALTFLLVMLHTGTMLAVLVYFWPRWRQRWRLESRVPKSAGAAGFVGMTVLATACTGAVGLALKFGLERLLLERVLKHPHGEVEALFRNLPLMGAALLAVGLLTIVAGARAAPSPVSRVTLRQAILIGLVQALALPFRGFSRSGATISVGLLAGMERGLAEDFSFALAVWLTPPVIVLELHRLMKAAQLHSLTASSLAALVWPGIVGMGISLVAGLVALWWLSAWLERGRWQRFGVYCVALAGLVWIGHRLGL